MNPAGRSPHPVPPRRLVSLVPSLTDLVFWLGRGETLVGRTRFCIEPADAVERVPVVGGTKDPDVASIVALAPDLVVANREENRREDVDALRSAGLEVLVTDPCTVEDAHEMISGLGALLGRAAEASALVAESRETLAEPPRRPMPRVFVAVWRRPLMGLGSGTYGHDLLQRAGAVNVLHDLPRYPQVSRDQVRALQPDLVLLPDEPYRFKQRHVEEYSGIAPARVIDGRMPWWYGPRMPAAVRSLRAILAEVDTSR